MNTLLNILGGSLTFTVLCIAAPPSDEQPEDVVADFDTVDAEAPEVSGGGFTLSGGSVDMQADALAGGGFTLVGRMTAPEKTDPDDVDSHGMLDSDGDQGAQADEDGAAESDMRDQNPAEPDDTDPAAHQ